MEYKSKTIRIKDLIKDYVNSDENGVFGYSGKLNIRPAFQREFVYDDKKRDAVIETIRKNMPIGVMWWSDNGDGTYELLDGQQRSISLCEYVTNKFSIYTDFVDGLDKGNYKFDSLSASTQDMIMNYELMVYIFKGTESEKLAWFKTINIAGEVLTQQELRNAVYTGTWLEDAKKYFSKTNCAAYKLGSDYMNGKPIRQDYLETVIGWKADEDGLRSKDVITEYMSIHQHDKNANQLWVYYQNVINWVKTTFPTYYKEMKGIDWGLLYNKYHQQYLDSSEIDASVKNLMADEEVQKKKGIFEYLLSGEEKLLNLRAFSESVKRTVYEKQQGICPHCGKHYEFVEMHGDHINCWSRGGKTVEDNCQMLCVKCNLKKSAII